MPMLAARSFTASRHHGQRKQPLQLNLGSLRSAMSLTLHTHHASHLAWPRAAEGGPASSASTATSA
jgi:hypothetical protein